MNRSIFIVIVDFLLLSLIAFARFDSDQPPPKRQPQPGANIVQRQQDVMDVLKVSLDQERQQRDQLNQQLNVTQEALRSREQLLSEREARMREAQENLQRKTEEARRLAGERAALETQFADTRSHVATMQTQLAASSNDARLSRQRLSGMESDLRRRQEELAQAKSEAQFSRQRLTAMETDLRKRQEAFEAANSEARVTKGVLEALQQDLRKQHEQSLHLQQNLSKIEQERTAAEAEKQLLAGRLQVVETEKRLAREQVDTMRTQVQSERAEKSRLLDTTSKLTEGVSALAQKSEALAQKSDVLAQKSEALRAEIQQTRPLAPNTFYSEFLTNRVTSSVYASRIGLVGQRVERSKDANSVLVTDGTNTCALLHVEDTPLSFGNPGTDWERLMVSFRNRMQMVSASQLMFWAYDPRVVLVPIDLVRAKALAVKIYPLARDPHQFQEAILVGAKDQYYGECKFQLDAGNPQYVRMDRNIFKRLVGNFSPSSGDLVFSKNGQILGVMVNKEYCALVNNFASLYSLRTGMIITNQQTGAIFAALRIYLDQLPFKLQ